MCVSLLLGMHKLQTGSKTWSKCCRTCINISLNILYFAAHKAPCPDIAKSNGSSKVLMWGEAFGKVASPMPSLASTKLPNEGPWPETRTKTICNLHSFMQIDWKNYWHKMKSQRCLLISDLLVTFGQDEDQISWNVFHFICLVGK
jgi:hypothetical protein